MSKRKNKNNSSSTTYNNNNGLFIKGYLPVRIRVPISIPVGGGLSSTSSLNIDKFHETILYVKEHQSGNTSSSTTTTTTGSTNDGSSNSATLFVANAPIVPNVSTQLLLKSIFGRYGEVIRVTVLSSNNFNSTNNMNKKNLVLSDICTINGYDKEIEILQSWTTTKNKFSIAGIDTSMSNNNNKNGQFAHVVFESIKEMKQSLQSLIKIMKSNTTISSNNDSSAGGVDVDIDTPAVTFDPIEIQTLADETDRQLTTTTEGDDDDTTTTNTTVRKYFNYNDNDSVDSNTDCYDDDNDNDNANVDSNNKRKRKLQQETHKKSSKNKISKGMMSIIERYHKQYIPNREMLLDECNTIMEHYETMEIEKQNKYQQSKQQVPDDDGFITVTYNNKGIGTNSHIQNDINNDDDEEEDDDNDNNNTIGVVGGETKRNNNHNTYTRSSSRPRSSKNNKKKKKGIGAYELNDFYRFQIKDVRKNALHELRTKFESDIAKIQQQQQLKK